MSEKKSSARALGCLILFALPFAASAGVGLLMGWYRPRARYIPDLGEPLNVRRTETSSVSLWTFLLIYPTFSWVCAFVGLAAADVASASVCIAMVAFALVAQLVHTGFLAYRTQHRPLLVVGLAAATGWFGVVCGLSAIAALWSTLK